MSFPACQSVEARARCAHGVKILKAVRERGAALLVVLGCAVCPAHAQTPSPLQEWQYSGGIILARLFEPNLPQWRVILGAAAQAQPAYDGSRAYRVEGGPVINIRYRDVAFLSTGEGLGYNFLRGDHYQVGLAMAYDRGREEKQDYANLRGMGDIPAAPVAKLYSSWVLSRKFPMILRVDARQFIGGAVGDAAVYLPLPGSSKSFVMFAGPSITLADNHYLQTLYGVSPAQSVTSGHRIYEIPHAGTSAAGVGFSATKFVTEHLLLNWMPRSVRSGEAPRTALWWSGGPSACWPCRSITTGEGPRTNTPTPVFISQQVRFRVGLGAASSSRNSARSFLGALPAGSTEGCSGA
jgi:outer membrane scaffolding protein for murein synthesis (MipA/OmpV family)